MSRQELDRLSPERKAAVLMILLGSDTAGQLLGALPRETAGRIAAEVGRVDEISSELAEVVLEEYFVEAIRPERHRGGKDMAREMLTSASIPEDQHLDWLGEEQQAPQVPEAFAPLLEAPEAALGEILAEEHPQTAALVLLNLEAAKAAAVLEAMSDEARGATVRRMTALKPVQGEILAEVAASLNERLSDPDAPAEEQLDGLARTALVLQQMRRSEVREMLEEVEKSDPEQAQQLRAMVNTFDMLLLANDRGIQELLRAVETKSLVLALHGEEPELTEKFLANLSERAAGMFREEMEYLSDVREEDTKNAQNEIMAVALELEKEDKLVFQEPQGSG